MELDAAFPALNLWQYELRKGIRTATTMDALWAAACEEMTARDFINDGLPEVAATNFCMAYDLVADAQRAS